MAAAAIATFSSVVNAFDGSVNTNMAVYWGQGANQQRLAHFCKDSTIDVIPIAFLNIFPDQINGSYPGTNFGNQCGAETYKNPDNSSSPLLSNCPLIGPDIKTCQDAGKIILLSLGGSIPTNQAIKDDASAIKFATFLWNAFGPEKPSYTGPRPFGDAAVNGFDFDIESILVAAEDASDLSRGYGVMIDTLRGLYALENKQYYISGAPQCVVPDAHLAPAITSSWFDFVFVQFYNTPQCSARAFFDHTYGAYGGPPTDISFDAWVSFLGSNSPNPNVKLYLGLPAAPAITYDAKMYLDPTDAKSIVEHFQCKYAQVFGGVMVYEATASESNSIGGKSYAKVLKDIEQNCECGSKPVTSSTLSSTTQASSSSTRIVVNSTLSSTTQSSSTLVSNSTGKSTSLPSSTGTGYSYHPAGTSVSTSGIPSAQSSSTGKWNSTTLSTSSPVYTPSASASAFTLHRSSYGRYNTSTPCSGPTNSPSSSSSSSGLHHYSSGTAPHPYSSGTAVVSHSSNTAPYPYSSGTVAFSYSSKTSPYPYSSGTVPIPQSSKTAPYPYSSGTASVPSLSATGQPIPYSSRTGPIPYPTGPIPHSTGPVAHSGPSSGVSLSPSSASSALSPTTQEVVTTVITTSYVTTCPVTKTLTSGGSQAIQTTLSTSTIHLTYTSTICTKCVAPSTPAPVKPSNTPPPAQTTDVVTTEIVRTIYTTCPVTYTATSGTQKIVQVSQTVSTMYETVTSTICTKCVAPPTPAPTIPTQAATTQEVVTTVIVYTTVTTCPVTQTVTSGTQQIVQVSPTVSTIYETVTSTICTKCVAPPTPAPTIPTQAATTQEVVTTVIVHTTLTTCPVTRTVTSGTKEIVHVSQTVSTIYQTVTSTVCTKCIAPPTPAPTGPATPAKTQEVVTTVIVYTTVTTCPVTETITIGTSSRLHVTQSVSTIHETTTSTICTKCVAPPTVIPGPGAPPQVSLAASTIHQFGVGSQAPVASPYSPEETGIPFATPVSPQVYGSPSASLEYLSVTPVSPPVYVSPSASLEYLSETPVFATFESHVTSTVVGVVTMTMIPVPVYATPAAESLSIVPVYSPVPLSNAPYPVASNGTVPAGPTGTAASASAGIATGTTVSFKGAANKMGMGLTGGIVLAAGIVALIM